MNTLQNTVKKLLLFLACVIAVPQMSALALSVQPAEVARTVRVQVSKIKQVFAERAQKIRASSFMKRVSDIPPVAVAVGAGVITVSLIIAALLRNRSQQGPPSFPAAPSSDVGGEDQPPLDADLPPVKDILQNFSSSQSGNSRSQSPSSGTSSPTSDENGVDHDMATGSTSADNDSSPEAQDASPHSPRMLKRKLRTKSNSTINFSADPETHLNGLADNTSSESEEENRDAEQITKDDNITNKMAQLLSGSSHAETIRRKKVEQQDRDLANLFFQQQPKNGNLFHRKAKT